MKKFTLMLFMTLMVVGASSKVVFDLTNIGSNIWNSSTYVSWNGTTNTISATQAWTDGATLWVGQDLSAYTHIYIRTSSNCDWCMTVLDNESSQTKAEYRIGASTAETTIIVPIPGVKSNFGGINIQFAAVGDITFKEAAAIKYSGEAPHLTYTDNPGSFWPSTPGSNGCTVASSYNSSTKTMIMGEFDGEHASNWCSVGWWVGWNSVEDKNSGTDYSAYDKVVVRFASPTAYQGNARVTYRTAGGDKEATESYMSFSTNAYGVEVPLNATYKNRVGSVVIEGPQQAEYVIESVTLVNSGKYYPLAGNATFTPEAISNANIELERPLKAGWNSICLPFATEVSKIAADAELYEFSAADASAITLTKKDDGDMVANTPYFVKATAAISDPIVFTNVTVSNAGAGSVGPFGGFTFKGNFEAGMDMKGKYGVTSNAIKEGASGAKLNAFAAYLEGTTPAHELGITIEDGDVTGISQTLQNVLNGEQVFYNLAGQRVDRPAKGVYIVNGKKVIIK